MARNAAELRALTQEANETARKAQVTITQAKMLAEEAGQQYSRISEKLSGAFTQTQQATQSLDESWRSLSIAVNIGDDYSRML